MEYAVPGAVGVTTTVDITGGSGQVTGTMLTHIELSFYPRYPYKTNISRDVIYSLAHAVHNM